MNPGVTLAAIGGVALVFVLIPVGLAARRQYRTYKLVRCPALGVGAGVLIRRAGLAEALGWRGLRRVADCTYWPRHRACAQPCRLVADEAMLDYRRPLV
jgi:hypothetical protein